MVTFLFQLSVFANGVRRNRVASLFVMQAIAAFTVAQPAVTAATSQRPFITPDVSVTQAPQINEADRKKYLVAIATSSQKLKSNPRDWTAIFNRASAEQSLFQNVAALRDYSKAIELNPRHALTYSFRGNVYSALGRFKDALNDYNQAVALNPANAHFWGLKAIAEEQVGAYKESVGSSAKALKLDPKDDHALRARTFAFTDMEMWDDALSAANEAIAVSPKDGPTYIRRAKIYIEQSYLDPALADATKAISLNPKDAGGYLYKGYALRRKKDFYGAIKCFDTAIRLFGSTAPWYYYKELAWCYAAVNRFDDAEINWFKGNDAHYLQTKDQLESKGKLSDAQKWALTCSAVLHYKNNRDCMTLAGYPVDLAAKQEAKLGLASSWGIRDKNQLDIKIRNLNDFSLHDTFAQMNKYVSSLNSAQYNDLEEKCMLRSGDESVRSYLNRLRIVHEYGNRLSSAGILGWDLSRAINICREAYVAGIIDEKEAWERIMPLAKRLQKSYGKWSELGENYLIGRRFWSERSTVKESDDFELALKLLTHCKNSPYQRLKWLTALSTDTGSPTGLPGSNVLPPDIAGGGDKSDRSVSAPDQNSAVRIDNTAATNKSSTSETSAAEKMPGKDKSPAMNQPSTKEVPVAGEVPTSDKSSAADTPVMDQAPAKEAPAKEAPATDKTPAMDKSPATEFAPDERTPGTGKGTDI